MPKVSIQEASDLLGVHPDTLRRWVEVGKIVAERTSGGHRRYDVSKLLGTAEREGKTICYARGLHSPTERGFAASVSCACRKAVKGVGGNTK